MTRLQSPAKSLFKSCILGVLSISLLTIGNTALGQVEDRESRAPTARTNQLSKDIALEEMSETDIEEINGRPLISRQIIPKTNKLIKPTGYDARLIIKFADDMKARPQADGMIMSRSRQSTFEVDVLARRYGAIFSSPFRKLQEGDLNRIRSKAALNSGKAQPDLAGMMYIEVADAFSQQLAKELQALDCVEWIAYETKPEPHGYVNSSPPAATLAASTMAPVLGAGACCVGTGCIQATQADCNNVGGNFVGGLCAADTCTGACCFPQGFQNACLLLTSQECAVQGGTFNLATIGQGQAACATGCEGRGCEADGACVDNAVSNQFPQADFVIGGTCALNPCPPAPGLGACCVPAPAGEALEAAECEETDAATCGAINAIFQGGLTCDEALCLEGACTSDFIDPNATITITTLADCANSYDPLTNPNPSFAGFGHNEQTDVFELARDGFFGSCCLGTSCMITFGVDIDGATEACSAIGDELGVPSFWTPPEFINDEQEVRNSLCTELDNQGFPTGRCRETGICAIPGEGCFTTSVAICVGAVEGTFIAWRDTTGNFPPLECGEPLSPEVAPGDEVLFGTCCAQGAPASNVVNIPASPFSCLSNIPTFQNIITGARVRPYAVYVPDDEIPEGIPKAICDRLGFPWEVIFTSGSTDCIDLPCQFDSGLFPCGYDWWWLSWTGQAPVPGWTPPADNVPSQRYQGPCHQALTFYNCWDYGDTDTPGTACCDDIVGLYAGCSGQPGQELAEIWNTWCQQLAMSVCDDAQDLIEQVAFPPLAECPVVYAGLGLPRPLSANTFGYCPCIGSVLAGPCDQPNGTRGCENAQCCTTVCAIESFGYCCTAGWDSGCAEIASIMCNRSQENSSDPLFPPIPRCSDPMCADYDTPDFTDGQGYLTPIAYGFRETFYGGQVSSDFPTLAFPTPSFVQPNLRGILPACTGFESGVSGYMGQGLYLEEWRKKKLDPFWYKWAGLYGIGAEYQQEYGRDLASTDGVIYNRTRGYGVRVAVIDYSYIEMHEDLNVTLEPDVTMQLLPEPYGPAHGTAVLGIINAVDQTRPNPGLPNNDQPNNLEQIGVVGIAPEAEAYFFPLQSLEDGPRELEAWTNALNTLSIGDVICAPYGPNGGGDCLNTIEPVWQLAGVAADLGITVVMSAGNANQDLTGQPDFGDNGAIITAAGSPGGASSDSGDVVIPEWDASVTQGSIPLYFSSYNSGEPTGAGNPSGWPDTGNQISLLMWGRNVYTTGGTTPIVDLAFNPDFTQGIGNLDCYDPIDPFPIGPNWNPCQKAESNVAYGTRILERAYTNDFSGTSAAAAMVAAVACDVQGFHNQYYGIDASPQQLRAALTATARANSTPPIATNGGSEEAAAFYGFGSPRPREACLALVAQSDLAYDDSPWLDDIYVLTGVHIGGNIFSVKGEGDNNSFIVRTKRTRGTNSTDAPFPFNEVTYPVSGPITDIGVVVDSEANRFSAADVTVVIGTPGVRTAFFSYIYNPNTSRWDYLYYELLESTAEEPPEDDYITIDIPIEYVNWYVNDGDINLRFWTYQVDFGGAGLSTPGQNPSDDPHPSDYSLMRYEFIGFDIDNGGLGDGNNGGPISN